MGLRSIEQTDPELVADAEETWPDLRHVDPSLRAQGAEPVGKPRRVLAKLCQSIDVTSAAGFPNVITFPAFGRHG